MIGDELHLTDFVHVVWFDSGGTRSEVYFKPNPVRDVIVWEMMEGGGRPCRN